MESTEIDTRVKSVEARLEKIERLHKGGLILVAGVLVFFGVRALLKGSDTDFFLINSGKGFKIG